MTFFETHRHIEHIDFNLFFFKKLCVLCVYVFQKKVIQCVLKAYRELRVNKATPQYLIDFQAIISSFCKNTKIRDDANN